MASTPCPEDHDLLALVTGSTVPESVRLHVDACGDCQLRVDRLRAEMSAVRHVGRGAARRGGSPTSAVPADAETASRPPRTESPEDSSTIPRPDRAAAPAREHRPISDRRRARFGRPGDGLSGRAPDLAARPGDQDRPRAELDRPQPAEGGRGDPLRAGSSQPGARLRPRHPRRPPVRRDGVRAGPQPPRKSPSSRRRRPARRRRGSPRLRGRSSTYTVAGVVHQDIKPKNILLDESGRPRLIDFGMARWRHAWSDSQAGPSGGTLAFMAPEQARGESERVGAAERHLRPGWRALLPPDRASPVRRRDPQRTMAPRQPVRLRPRRAAGQGNPAPAGAHRPEGDGGRAGGSLRLGRRHGDCARRLPPPAPPARPPGRGLAARCLAAESGRCGRGWLASRARPAIEARLSRRRPGERPRHPWWPLPPPSPCGSSRSRSRCIAGLGAIPSGLVGINAFAGRLDQDVRGPGPAQRAGVLLPDRPESRRLDSALLSRKAEDRTVRDDHDRLPVRPGLGLRTDRRSWHPGLRADRLGESPCRPMPSGPQAGQLALETGRDRGRLAIRRPQLRERHPARRGPPPGRPAARPWKRPAAPSGPVPASRRSGRWPSPSSPRRSRRTPNALVNPEAPHETRHTTCADSSS